MDAGWYRFGPLFRVSSPSRARIAQREALEESADELRDPPFAVALAGDL